MKSLSTISTLALAGAAFFSLNVLAADDAAQPQGATTPPAAQAPHMMSSESMAAGKMSMMKDTATAEAPKDKAKKKSKGEPDRSRHYHPRDGK